MGDETERRPEDGYVRKVVAVVGEFVALGGCQFEAKHGDQAATVVQELMAALMGQLEGNLGYVVLWEQFLQTPDEVSDALVSVVTELQCRNSTFDGWLVKAWRRYLACAREEADE